MKSSRSAASTDSFFTRSRGSSEYEYPTLIGLSTKMMLEVTSHAYWRSSTSPSSLMKKGPFSGGAGDHVSVNCLEEMKVKANILKDGLSCRSLPQHACYKAGTQQFQCHEAHFDKRIPVIRMFHDI